MSRHVEHRLVVTLGTARRTHPLEMCAHALAILSYIVVITDVLIRGT